MVVEVVHLLIIPDVALGPGACGVVVDGVGEALRQARVPGPVHVLVRRVQGRAAEVRGVEAEAVRLPVGEPGRAGPGSRHHVPG